MGKYEVTQGEWKRVVGKLRGVLTVGGGEGDDLPVYNVNYAEAEGFCSNLTARTVVVWTSQTRQKNWRR